MALESSPKLLPCNLCILFVCFSSLFLVRSEDGVELGRWAQRCAALALEALSSPGGRTLWVSHTWVQGTQPATLHNHSWGTQNVSSEELLLSEFKFMPDSRTRFVTPTIRNHLQSFHFYHMKSQSKSYFPHEKSIFFWPGTALDWVYMKATTCHVRLRWPVIQLTPLIGKLI